MSPLEQELYSSCTKKRHYHSHKLAKSVARRRVAEDPTLMLGVYKCQHCCYYHLTSDPVSWGLRVIGIGQKAVVDLL